VAMLATRAGLLCATSSRNNIGAPFWFDLLTTRPESVGTLWPSACAILGSVDLWAPARRQDADGIHQSDQAAGGQLPHQPAPRRDVATAKSIRQRLKNLTILPRQTSMATDL
jgi:hypothetical protein